MNWCDIIIMEVYMKIKKDKKFIFWSTIIAMICIIAAKILEIINHGFYIGDVILHVLMVVVVLRCLMTGCFEKK